LADTSPSQPRTRQLARPTVRSVDLRAVLAFVEQLLEVRSFATVETVLLPGLAGLLSSDMAAYHHVDLRWDALEEIDVFWPYEHFLPLAPAYNSVMRDHPFVRGFAQLPRDPMRITDFLSEREWLHSSVYAESHGPLGARQQLSYVLASRGSRLRAVTVARARSAYTDRERDLLPLVGAHLKAALTRAYAGPGGGRALRLVPTVEPVVLGRHDRVLHAVPAPSGSPLTDREHEVMELVAVGLTNTQVARRLQVADGTVAKHLEHVYGKLGVDNRIAALRVLDGWDRSTAS
jgi:DNA-binding CsgD family transcriptional regulator